MSPREFLEDADIAQKRLSEAIKKRLRAERMLLSGIDPAEVGLAVGVARQTVYPWKRLLDEGGIDALRAVPERGRPAQLDQAKLAALRASILRSPTEHGFATELWTLKCVGAVIERMHGVRFGQTNVWLLLGSMGVSPQKPDKRAIERDEEAVRHWKGRTWTALKKSSTRRSADRLHRRVGHQRTTDPCSYLGAQVPTPIIQFHFNWNHVSVIAGLTRTNFLFRLHEGSIQKELVALSRHG